MAIKKIQLYKNNVDGTETLLNPLTKASYVTMEDGTLIEEALTNKDSSKYTPSIESSKSMFKVGVGDSVDLSSSVVDGAYNSCVLKGRTLVNIASKVINKPVNSTTDNTTFTLTTYTDKWQTVEYDKSLLKTNTKYTIFLTVLQNDGSHTLPIKVQLGNGSGGYLDVKKGYTGRLVATLTTMSEIPDTLSIGLRSSTIAGEVVKVSNFIVLEGDYSNEDFPYFTGMCDVKSPILSNIGETVLETPHEQEYGLDATREFFRIVDCAKTFDSFGANKPYTLSFDIKANKAGTARIYQQNGSGVKYLFAFEIPVGVEYTRHCVKVTPVLVDANIEESWLSCYTTYDSGCFATIKNVRISTGSNDEPYKSNILTCDTYFDEVSQSDKTIVLRSLPNGTCDTLNVETGEYIQRIGEKVYDGSTDELWKLDTWWHNKITTIGAEIPIDNKGDSMFCDYFKVSSYDRIYKTDEEAITLSTDYNVLMLRISRSRLSAETLDGIKTWLQSNPITVQYQLATPIVKTVNLSGFPYAYKDGHVILESGSVEQSLTPKVEYSLVANRNGQIEANTKRVMAHQKELDNFEALMLTQIVQSHYDKAILQFDYEMQMMSLGGE